MSGLRRRSRRLLRPHCRAAPSCSPCSLLGAAADTPLVKRDIPQMRKHDLSGANQPPTCTPNIGCEHGLAHSTFPWQLQISLTSKECFLFYLLQTSGSICPFCGTLSHFSSIDFHSALVPTLRLCRLCVFRKLLIAVTRLFLTAQPVSAGQAVPLPRLPRAISNI